MSHEDMCVHKIKARGGFCVQMQTRLRTGWAPKSVLTALRSYGSREPMKNGNKVWITRDTLNDIVSQHRKRVKCVFDKTIHALDPKAYQESLPQPWLMTLVSIYGLGFQLLLLGCALIWAPTTWILPGIVAFTVFMPLFITLRKYTQNS